MSKYVTVTQSLYDGDKSLDDAVNRMMEGGYIVLGPPIPIKSVSTETIGSFKGLADTTTRFTYAQPMIKDDQYRREHEQK